MDALPSAGNKRKVRDEDPSGASGSVSEDEIATSDSGDSCDSGGSGSAGPPSILRRSRSRRAAKRVRFAQVTVYYFARRQGFTCVPSAGGSSLGMALRHHRARRYSLSQFAHLRQVSHRQHLRQHLRREKLRARRRELTQRGAVPEAAGLTLADVSEDELDVGQLQVGDCFYLQPLPTKRRRALLRAAGVRRIDAEERQELRALRLSREQCGCLCQLTCEPRTCACSQAGIQCQVDRSSFPCGCSREGCANAAGRVEFNALRVRTHLLHTLLRVQRQGRQRQDEEEEEEGGEEGAGAAPVPPWAPPAPPETQDFQEYLAENERAVLHLHRAQELERLQAEGGEGGGHGGGHCVLGEHLDGTTWQVRALPCPGHSHCPPGSPLLGLPPEPAQGGTEVGTLGGTEVGSQVGTQGGSQESSQVGCQMGTQVSSQLGTEVGSQVGTQESSQVGSQVSYQVDSQVGFQGGSQVGSQPYLAEAPKLYNPDGKGGNGHGEPLAHLGVTPVPVAVSEEGAPPPTHLEHLEQPHLEQPHLEHLEQPHLEQPHLEHLEQPHLEQPHLPI